MGTMSTLHATTPVSHAIGFTVFEGVGMGLIYSATYFPVLAPLPVSQNAHALAFFSFLRSFASVRLKFRLDYRLASYSRSVARSGVSLLVPPSCKHSSGSVFQKILRPSSPKGRRLHIHLSLSSVLSQSLSGVRSAKHSHKASWWSGKSC